SVGVVPVAGRCAPGAAQTPADFVRHAGRSTTVRSGRDLDCGVADHMGVMAPDTSGPDGRRVEGASTARYLIVPLVHSLCAASALAVARRRRYVDGGRE